MSAESLRHLAAGTLGGGWEFRLECRASPTGQPLEVVLFLVSPEGQECLCKFQLPATASVQPANSSDADVAITTDGLTAATPTASDTDLLMEENLDEFCELCEICGHRPAAWELGGHECWVCFGEH